MKIALVHDYLSQDGGAERVLKALHEIWPEAPIFVLFHDQKKISYFPIENIQQSILSNFPLIKKMFTWYLPLMPYATEKYQLNDFDVVISSTSAFSKGLKLPSPTLHISYCHTPPRFLWTDTVDYISSLRKPWSKIFMPNLLHYLRQWDKKSIKQVHHFIANSQTVSGRIHKYYRRTSDIIHPPVDTKNFFYSPAKNYFLAGGRLVAYKKFNLIVSTFNRLGYPLKIFGQGPELKYLKKQAKNNIEFLGHINEPDKINLFAEAKAFINPQFEDFGITSIEAMSAGKPVIAYNNGGATETIIDRQTGLFFNHQQWESLFQAIQTFENISWDNNFIQCHAKKFDEFVFKEKMKNYVQKKWSEYQNNIN